ncbi:hypothetical protein AcW1_005561 [Taiwanofungus camphoratus]|nr:hypothetical protein AcW2_004330 [Antrodia cinnamomea]KAI0933849.1 hypothetical protein AcV5_005885 [Antrodia cinnamomea]KAI0957042.1 hypothetical protein AcW1_005561 [Antrodia cinnamomea]
MPLSPLLTATRRVGRSGPYSLTRTKVTQTYCRVTQSVGGSRLFSSGSSAKSSSDSNRAKGLQGFLLGAGVATVVGYYVQQSISLDGTNVGHGTTARPESTPKTTKYDTLPIPPEASRYASKEKVQQAIAELRAILPREDAVLTDPDTLKTYGHSDNSYHPTSPHSVVVVPHSTEDVVKVVNVARKYRVPIVPYSGATSLEGHFSGYPSGDICLDMSQMDKILEIHEKDGDLVCQSGARWEDINQTLKDKGIPLFFPLDPGPGATVGGMIGTGCSGTNAVRYGTAKSEWFLNITAVLPNGKVIKTRRRARKSSAGFDLTKIFIGAEGTLGIVTEATLRLAPLVPTKVAMAQFPDVERAVSAVQEILNTPHGPHIQCVELLDDHMMAAINTAGAVSNTYPISDTLFFKLQGDQAALDATAHAVKATVARHGSTRFEFAQTDQEAAELWESRKYALISTIGSVPGSKCWTTDVCVPVSRLPQLIYETKKDLADHKLQSTIVGHVGDGNFHALILFQNDEELQRVSEAVHRLVHRAISLDGTCTGEHGVGVGKKEYLVDELGEDTVELMRTIKRAVDPLNILNPSKLYPDPVGKLKKD